MEENKPDARKPSESIDGRFRDAALDRHGRSDGLGPVMEVGKPSSDGPRVPRRWRAELARLRQRPIGYVPPVEYADCGPACLAAVLEYHGIAVDIDTLRDELGTGRNGVSAKALVQVGAKYGLVGRGVRASLDALRHLPPGTILFWDFNHFVVLESYVGDHLQIVDPAHGRRRIRTRDADKSFTGVAIEFLPTTPALNRVKRGSRRRQALARLGYFLPRTRAWVTTVVTSIAIVLFSLALPISVGQVVDQSSKSATSSSTLGVLVIALVILGVGYFLLLAARGFAIVKLQSLMDKNSTVRLFAVLMSLPYDYFARRHPGDLLQRTRTSLRIRNIISALTISAAFDSILVLIYLAILVSRDPLMALIAAGLGAALAGVVAATWRRLWNLSASTLDAQVQANSNLMELIEGVLTVKALGAEPAVSARWQNLFAQEVSSGTRYRRSLSLVSAVVTAIQFVAPLCILLVGFFQLRAGSVSLGDVVSFSALSVGFFTPLSTLALALLQMSSLGPELSRVSDIVDNAPTVERDFQSIDSETAGEIELDDVEFTYKGSAVPAVSGLTIAFKRGSYVGVLGASGSGKSTLGLLVAGIYLPTRGRIEIDGVQTTVLDMSQYRSDIGYVDQNSRLFFGSIAENLLLGAVDASRESMIRAAKLAEIHDAITALPMEYETILGVGGGGLSGGQRQRIALARCLLSEPRTIILDEATSAVDPETERKILANLRSLGATLVVIAHRLSLVDDADKVIVLADGRVRLSGSPEEVRLDRRLDDDGVLY